LHSTQTTKPQQNKKKRGIALRKLITTLIVLALAFVCHTTIYAKSEAIEEILDAAYLKEAGNLKALVVTGCLAQRYAAALADEMVEVDGFMGVADYARLYDMIDEAENGGRPIYMNDGERFFNCGRVLTTAPSNHFIQGLTYYFAGGARHALPYYMTAPATWTMLDAIAGMVPDLRDNTLTIAPKMKGKIPVFTHEAWFMVEATDTSVTLTPFRRFVPHAFDAVIVDGVRHTVDGGFDPGEHTIRFDR
jgi:hypothetical protein